MLLSTLARNTDVAKVAGKIHEELSSPYKHHEFTIVLHCFIGVSLFPDDAQEKDDLVRKAISALNEAENRGIPYLLYDKGVHEKAIEKMKLESDLYRAFHDRQFDLYYQPVVDINGKVMGAEALIRWNHPAQSLLTPASFIPLAEEVGLIDEIGKWALFTATRQASRWLERFNLYFTINLSAPEFESEHIEEVIEAALSQAGNLDTGYLKFELTESEAEREDHRWSI